MRLGGIASDVIPAKAGIRTWRPMRPSRWIPAFAGMKQQRASLVSSNSNALWTLRLEAKAER